MTRQIGLHNLTVSDGVAVNGASNDETGLYGVGSNQTGLNGVGVDKTGANRIRHLDGVLQQPGMIRVLAEDQKECSNEWRR